MDHLPLARIGTSDLSNTNKRLELLPLPEVKSLLSTDIPTRSTKHTSLNPRNCQASWKCKKDIGHELRIDKHFSTDDLGLSKT